MTALPDRCDRCACDDCGGTLAQHEGSACDCDDCTNSISYGCTTFEPPARIDIIADQLALLLSAHLGPKQQSRCIAVAHAAHHALLDYDRENTR